MMVLLGEKGEPLVALRAEVVAPRKAPDAAELRQKLSPVIEEISRHDLDLGLATRASLSEEGGAWALFSRPAGAVRVVAELTLAARPYRIAVGLGRGRIYHELRPEALENEGPALHRAEEALTLASRQGRGGAASGFGDLEDVLISSTLTLIAGMRQRWTDRQATYAHAARTMMQKEVAEKFEVSPSVVSESLKAAGLDAVGAGEEALERLLANFGTS